MNVMKMNVHDFMNVEGNTYAITNAIAKAWDILGRFERPLVSVSGGSDSDIVMDMIYRLDDTGKVRYGWFNTGLEWDATKRHLRFLEEKYGVEIIRFQPVKPVAWVVKNWGYPFSSKYASYCLYTLIKHGYDFRGDSTYERDIQEFHGCKDGLDWWYSTHDRALWNISMTHYLRDFLVQYPPKILISDKCCHYTKKLPSERMHKSGEYDLQIIGVRRFEGGVRSNFRNCFVTSERKGNRFMPILHFTNADKARYNELYGIENSDCYTVYGFARTGCAGCPYNRFMLRDLNNPILQEYEPGLLKAARAVFQPAYDYTELYSKYCEARYILDGRADERYRLFRQ